MTSMSEVVTREDSRKQMAGLWKAMWEAAESYEENERSRSGLVGGQGGIMEKYLAEKEPLSGAFAGQVIVGGAQNGRVQRMYETNRGGSYSRGLRRDAGCPCSLCEKI